ncbi:hypothetical protein LCGC14_2012250 [marine sediment metagenome]|uniref:Uncharacterized protein n=1 Tax=marine sediment metagenome TaxID=412755 RepID=A0A0F9HX57_9ZZZZ
MDRKGIDTGNLRSVECKECRVSLSEWKYESVYTECPLCGCKELSRTEWGE